MEQPLRALYIADGWLLPGRRRVVPYSIQTLKRLKPDLFRQDWIALLDLLARQAQELLAQGGVIGRIVLVPDGSSRERPTT